MTATAIRQKLYDYIRVAKDRKVKAIYTMLEEEIEENTAWWQDNGFVKELDADYKNWKDGKAKGYTKEEVSTSIEQLLRKRSKK